MDKKRALVMVRLDPPIENEVAWNEWYDTNHLANRLALPGYLFGRRFIAIEGEPKYLTLYDLVNVDMLNSEPRHKLQDIERSLPPDSFEAKMLVLTSKVLRNTRGVYE